jgi:hypothetical protein
LFDIISSAAIIATATISSSHLLQRRPSPRALLPLPLLQLRAKSHKTDQSDAQ